MSAAALNPDTSLDPPAAPPTDPTAASPTDPGPLEPGETEPAAGKRCPQCRSALPADAPAGLCPRCLLSGGLMSQLGSITGGAPGRFVAPGLEELAEHFPDLDLQAMLGRGGMGAVYKARQAKLDRVVALKVLPPEVGRDDAFAERFLREARTLARLNHPNIVQVYDFGQTTPGPGPDGEPREGLFYFLMEYVDGANLRDVMSAPGSPSPLGGARPGDGEPGGVEPAKALEIVRQICAALQFAHARGIVHRDVKPENILLDPKGDDGRGAVKIADFGLAKLGRSEDLATGTPWTLTGTRQAMGTPHYMAPEQMRGTRDVDHRADIYSLGVVFYELLTGELPLGRFAPPSQFLRERGRSRSDVRLDDIILKALEGEPAKRYQSVSDVRAAVDSLGLPGDPATPQIGDLDLSPPPASPGSPSPLGGAPRTSPKDAGNVRVTVDGRGRGPASRQDRVVNGLMGGIGGLLVVGGLLTAGLAPFVLYGSVQGPVLMLGLFAALLGTGLAATGGTAELAHRAGDGADQWSRLGPVLGELLRSLGWPLAVGAASAFLWTVMGAPGEVALFLAVATGVAVAVWRLARRPTPPLWWPGVWDWYDRPPLTPLSDPPPAPPRTPTAGAAWAPVGAWGGDERRPPVAAPAARVRPAAADRPGAADRPAAPAGSNDSTARRAAEVKRNLVLLFCLLTGLAGAVAALGAALATAGSFMVDWSGDPLEFGLILLTFGGGVRMAAAVILAIRPLGYEPDWKERWFGGNSWKDGAGRWVHLNGTVWLVDLWDCGVTLLWTAAASAIVALPLSGLFGYEAALWGVPFGLLTAAWATLRRSTPPIWWPPGWGWRSADGGRSGGVGAIAGALGYWGPFLTPPGGLSRPAIAAAAWLLTMPAAAIAWIITMENTNGPPDVPIPAWVMLIPLTMAAVAAPLAVPLLGWAGVRQVRTSQARGDDPAIWGRRLGVFCAWIFPTVLCMGAGAGLAAGAVALWHYGFEGRVRTGFHPYEVDVHIGVGAVVGATVGLTLAVLLWVKLSRLSRGPVPPPVRPEPPVGGPQDTGAGLSRIFNPRVNPATGRRQWGETLAAVCAAAVVLCVAVWWWGSPRYEVEAIPRVQDQGSRAVMEATEAVEEAHGHGDSIGWTNSSAPMPAQRFRPFEETNAEGDPWYGRLRLTDEYRLGGLGLDAGQAETLEAAANRVRRQWAAELAKNATAQVDDTGAVTFRFPALADLETRWEREFYNAVDPVLNVSQQQALRENLMFGNDIPHNVVEGDLSQFWLIPLGVYTDSVRLGRQGAWFDTIYVSGRTHVPSVSSAKTPARALPVKLKFLGEALKRFERGEPAFPTPEGDPATDVEEATDEEATP